MLAPAVPSAIPHRWLRTVHRVKAPFVLALLFGSTAAVVAEEPKRAPAGFVIYESDLGGAYFIARPLKDKYDVLLQQVATLKTEIAEARIDEAEARKEIARLKGDIDRLIGLIDRAKKYVPATKVQTRSVAQTFPLPEDGLILVQFGNVEIRGGDRPEVECVVEKTVLGAEGPDADREFQGIRLVHRRVSGSQMFGYYKAMESRAAKDPVARGEWERFPFKPFLDQDFDLITLEGLTGQEGNHQITLERRNEDGEGSVSSQWRRHARLILRVPKCRGVGVQGALEGFRVRGVRAPVFVQGEGDRDYQATYEVNDLGGSFVADNIPIHRLEGIRGDATVIATAYSEDVQTAHSSGGVAMRPVAPRGSTYRDIGGSLRVRFCRADLTVEQVAGQVDIENDFGRTVWTVDRPPARKDHRIVAQAGSTELRLAPELLDALPLILLTECGAVHLASNRPELQSWMFSSSFGDVARRSWHGFFSKPGGAQERFPGLEGFERVADALHGRPREPGIDLLSRAGTIKLTWLPKGKE